MEPTIIRIEPKDLSYSNSFPSPRRHFIIRWIENLTGRITILRLAARHQREAPLPGDFWQQALARMGIDTDIGARAMARIPATGPLIVVANHPHGLVDGMVLCRIISQVRSDFKIMTRAFLTKVPDINAHMLPVAFDHEDDAIRKNVDARKKALDHVIAGGCLILFPAGGVSHAKTAFGQAEDAEWTPFLARLVNRSKGTVMPFFFRGQNSRLYLLAARFSPTLRQGLLMHEVARSLNKPMRPIAGEPISYAELAARSGDQRDMVSWLRQITYELDDGLPEWEVPAAAE